MYNILKFFAQTKPAHQVVPFSNFKVDVSCYSQIAQTNWNGDSIKKGFVYCSVSFIHFSLMESFVTYQRNIIALILEEQQ